jgi:hypothetical protein
MNQVVRPENRREFMNKLVKPYYPQVGNPNDVFSEPTKLGQPESNRAKEISVKNDEEKEFYIGMKDLNNAVLYYFNNVLKLSVMQNNTHLPVPVLYATPENWKSVQNDGYYRDQKGKLMAPLIMFKRSSTTQNRTLGNKIDGNVARNVQLFEKSYTSRNNYGNFTVLNNRAPQKEYVVAITPDYVTVEYECIVWTYYIEQMDKLIESLNFASRSYWGDPGRFQFYSSIETFNDDLTYEVGNDRAVKCTFNLTLNGYLIPDSLNKSLAGSNRYYGASQILFGLETASTNEQQKENMRKPEAKKISRIMSADSINNVFISGGISDATITYLFTNKQVVGAFVNSTTVTFPQSWATAPSGIPANNIDNFSFFANGQFIEKTAVVSFVDNLNGTSTLVINPTVLSYSFESTDLILGVGKFN